jgi:dissimilatory sulfite reductase (desulfoviridin) alpha/beta subunit
MVIFSNCEEIGFDWNELEDMDEKEINQVVKNIVEFIESYANGGLQYLQEEWGNDNLINSSYLFADLMNN